MVLRRRWSVGLLAGALFAGHLLAAVARADERPRAGEVMLPLKDYLALVDAGEAAQRAAAERLAHREPPLAEVTAQAATVTLLDGEARIASHLEVLIQGAPNGPVALPIAGYPESIVVKRLTPAGTGAAGSAPSAVSGIGGAFLIAPAAGRYAVEVTSRARGKHQSGIWRLPMPAVAAPVSTLDLDLPADAGWSCNGAIVVEEAERGARRHVRLSTRRGLAPILELRRRVESTAAQELLAQAVVLTIFQLRPEGARRHDVVLYEVARGGLDRFEVTLPPGVEPIAAGTDEGAAVPIVENGRATLYRQRALRGTGYLVFSSAPAPLAETGGRELLPVLPQVEVRARYLAVASAVAARVEPQPAARWSRVDLDDLPALLREAMSAIDLVAAWRLAGEGETSRLDVVLLPTAAVREAAVRRRETTTLLTVDGTVLHRDSLVLAPAGASLDLALGAGSTLWSVRVNDEPVVPLERPGGVSVPLGFEAAGGETRVEVVTVAAKAIPPGRSELALELPQIALPVLEHRWRVLLPEGPRYRFRGGELRPAPDLGAIPSAYDFDSFGELQATPKALTDRINVGGNETGQESVQAVEETITVTAEKPLLDPRKLTTGATVSTDELGSVPASGGSRKKEARLNEARDAARNRAVYAEQVANLKQGLVGGIRPLAIDIPETGKALLMTGVLPPARITAVLDVKGKG